MLEIFYFVDETVFNSQEDFYNSLPDEDRITDLKLLEYTDMLHDINKLFLNTLNTLNDREQNAIRNSEEFRSFEKFLMN